MTDLARTIHNWLRDHQPEMMDLLRRLAACETPSREPDSHPAILDLLARELTAIGYASSRYPGRHSGGVLLARPAARTRGAPLQLMIGHADTVWPVGTLLEMPLHEQGTALHGPGVFDMKAGLTQMVFALRALQAIRSSLPATPVLLINTDEEVGSHDSTPAIRRLARIAARAFILEPPLGTEGKLKTARKGIGRFTLVVQGRASHAGLDPEAGASAIVELSHQIQQLFALNDPARGISVNVGLIEGGVSPNVVAPESRAVVDVRVLSQADAREITERIHALQPQDPDTRILIEGRIGRPPMEPTPANRGLWETARQLGRDLGLELDEATAGGGSDGNTTSLYTATLDGLGTTGDGAHAHHEHIRIPSLIERTALLALLLQAPLPQDQDHA